MGRHLTFKDRKKIEKMVNTSNDSAARIAREIGCSRLTIYNEMERGGAKRVEGSRFSFAGYSAKKAQATCDMRKRNHCPRQLRIAGHEEILDKIAAWLREGKSVETCSHMIAKEYKGLKVSRSTIYTYIHKGLIPGVSPTGHPQSKKHLEVG